MATKLHLAIDAFALQLLLERPQRLVDIVIANDDLHKAASLFPVCQNSRNGFAARRGPRRRGVPLTEGTTERKSGGPLNPPCALGSLSPCGRGVREAQRPAARRR